MKNKPIQPNQPNQVNFGQYLQDLHADNYMGNDDDMSDDYSNWITDIDIDELIDLADMWGEVLVSNL